MPPTWTQLTRVQLQRVASVCLFIYSLGVSPPPLSLSGLTFSVLGKNDAIICNSSEDRVGQDDFRADLPDPARCPVGMSAVIGSGGRVACPDWFWLTAPQAASALAARQRRAGSSVKHSSSVRHSRLTGWLAVGPKANTQTQDPQRYAAAVAEAAHPNPLQCTRALSLVQHSNPSRPF